MCQECISTFFYAIPQSIHIGTLWNRQYFYSPLIHKKNNTWRAKWNDEGNTEIADTRYRCRQSDPRDRILTSILMQLKEQRMGIMGGRRLFLFTVFHLQNVSSDSWFWGWMVHKLQIGKKLRQLWFWSTSALGRLAVVARSLGAKKAASPVTIFCKVMSTCFLGLAEAANTALHGIMGSAPSTSASPKVSALLLTRRRCGNKTHSCVHKLFQTDLICFF